jgi:hypothetical protein
MQREMGAALRVGVKASMVKPCNMRCPATEVLVIRRKPVPEYRMVHADNLDLGGRLFQDERRLIIVRRAYGRR